MKNGHDHDGNQQPPARGGLLVRDRRGLEEARNLHTVVFDKTGTLTLGEHRVVAMGAAGIAEEDALRLAASVERDSEHPVARAIVTTAAERAITDARAAGFEAMPGRGVRARVDGRLLEVGGPDLLREQGLKLDAALEGVDGRWRCSRWPTRCGRSPRRAYAGCKRTGSRW